MIALVPTAPAAARVAAGAAPLGFALLEDTALDGLGLRMLRFAWPAGYDGPRAIAALEALDPAATAGVNHAYRIAAQAGAGSLDYADDLIAWPPAACPALGPIGMLDTGVNPAALRALGGTVITRDFARGQASAARHGTDVASVLADRRRLTGSTIYTAAVVGSSASGQDRAGVDSLLKGLDWLASEGVRVVNVSLAGPYNKLLARSIERALRDGMIIVAAVGNDGADGPPLYPAAFDTVIAVTAVDADRNIYRAAGHGRHVDIAAPGVDVTIPAAARTRFVSGTSIAAPFVTARIVADPSLYGRSASDVRAALRQDTEDLGPPGRDRTFGWGLLRADRTCGG